MDKYTYSLKVEKIGKLVRQGDYAQAAKIADTMEWGQERNVRLLTVVGEAYEKTGQYTKAIDVLLTAYERSAIGKRLMYKLTELAIAAGDLEDAEIFYKKYLQEAPDENNRFLLRYKIAEAKGEDLEKRIAILEIYKKHEFDEEWACRLAELYQEAGRAEECVALCDEIILWFGVGPYVDRAMELKESFRPLTDAQREHRENREYYEARVKAVANEMAQAVEEKTATLGISEDEAAESQGAVPEEAEEEEELPVIAISDEPGMAKLADAAGAMLTPEPDLPVIPDEEEFELPEDDLSETQVFGRREKMNSEPQAPEAHEEPAIPEEDADPEEPEALPEEDHPADAEPEAEEAVTETADTAEEAAEKKMTAAESAEEDLPDDIFMEDELAEDGLLSADMVETVFEVPEEDMEEEPVPVRKERTEKPVVKEEAKPVKAEKTAVKKETKPTKAEKTAVNKEAKPTKAEKPAAKDPEEPTAAKEPAVKEPVKPARAEEPAPAKAAKPDRKIPQLTMPEIPEGDIEAEEPEEAPKKPQKDPAKGGKTAFQMPKMPDLRKLGKGRQTGGALPEPAIPPKDADPMELEEAINAALEAESLKEDGEYAEEKQPRTREEMAITRNLKNLLRRTLGNATVPPPESMGETQEFTLPRRRRREKDASAEENSRARAQAERPVKPERRKPAGRLPEEDMERSGAPIAPDSLDEILGEEEARTPKTRRQETQQPMPLADDSGVLPEISFDETARAAWEQNAGRREQTRSPLESKEMERCLFVEATGEEGVNRAVDALEAYYQARGREVGPIAKITGEKLNRRGLIKSLSQLESKDLIIDKAGALSNELLQEVLRVIERLDTNKVFVLMEEAGGMNELKERLTAQLLSTTSLVEGAGPAGRKPKAPAAETEPASSERQRSAKKVKPLNFDRMDPRQELSRADFLRYADYFARTIQCVIDESGFDALEDEIDLIRQEGGKLLAGEVEDVIEDAAENASRPSIRRMFGAKYNKDGFLILRDRNFT